MSSVLSGIKGAGPISSKTKLSLLWKHKGNFQKIGSSIQFNFDPLLFTTASKPAPCDGSLIIIYIILLANIFSY